MSGLYFESCSVAGLVDVLNAAIVVQIEFATAACTPIKLWDGCGGGEKGLRILYTSASLIQHLPSTQNLVAGYGVVKNRV